MSELKRRKGRPHKPLAVMFADLAQLRPHCACSAEEEALLESPEHPIVLVEWQRLGPGGEPLGERAERRAVTADERCWPGAARPVDPEVAVRQRYLGAMLPYTPLHLLLLRAAGRPLVMTSGNLAEEPIVKSWEEAGAAARTSPTPTCCTTARSGPATTTRWPRCVAVALGWCAARAATRPSR